MIIGNCIMLTKGFILCVVQVTVVKHSVIYHYYYACATHALQMSYAFVTILSTEKLHYTTATLRYDTSPFFDSYHTYVPVEYNFFSPVQRHEAMLGRIMLVL